jgi:hypothetical protein
MDRTCATTWMLCVLGLEVATWAAVRTPRVPVSITLCFRGCSPHGTRAKATPASPIS